MRKFVETGLFLCLLFLDQGTKLWAKMALKLADPIAIFPGLNMHLAYNKGAAFSFLNEAAGWQRPFLIVVSVLISLILVKWLYKTPPSNRIERFALIGVLSGAIGNLCDRVYLGSVIDFIEVYYHPYYWPAFNIADAVICVGVMVLLFILLRSKQSKPSYRDLQ